MRAADGAGAGGVPKQSGLKTRERYSNRGELLGVGGSEREGFV